MKQEVQVRISATRQALLDQLEKLCSLLDSKPRSALAEGRLVDLEAQLGDSTRLVRELRTLHRVAKGDVSE